MKVPTNQQIGAFTWVGNVKLTISQPGGGAFIRTETFSNVNLQVVEPTACMYSEITSPVIGNPANGANAFKSGTDYFELVSPVSAIVLDPFI